MRFAHYILCFAALTQIGSISAYAQNQENPLPLDTQASEYADLTLPSKTLPPRLQKGQRTDKLNTIEGLEFKRFARRLGQISAIARGAKGQLYTTDTDSGRVFIISDRNQDSRAKQIRPLPYRFNAPSAVIELGDTLYIADQDAIWTLPKDRLLNQAPMQLASLKNIQSIGRQFLIGYETTNQSTNQSFGNLIFGYSSQDGKARLISIDVETGSAQLIEQTDGDLQHIAISSGTRPWTAYRNTAGLNIGIGFDNPVLFNNHVSIKGLALPQKTVTPESWPDSLKDHILISQTNPVTVTAIPTSLGQALPLGRNIFTGFQNSRTAWGTAGVLHMDKRGLFVADPYNGDLWLLKPKGQAAKITQDDNLKAALENLKTVEQETETPLSRDPLDGIYDSLFPDPNAPKEETPAPQSPKP